MKTAMTLMLGLTLSLGVSGLAMAGTWDTRCIGCHKDGNAVKAPTKDELLAKHKSADAFIKAAMESKSPLMKVMQKEDLQKEAAKDLYK